MLNLCHYVYIHISNVNKSTGHIAYDPDDYKAKNTIKELTENNQYVSNVNQHNGHIAYNPTDYKAKNTIKELTENNQYVLGASRGSSGSVVYDPEIPEEARYYVGVQVDRDTHIATIYHDRDLTEEDIIHELLHVKYPDWSEDQVNKQTEKWLRKEN